MRGRHVDHQILQVDIDDLLNTLFLLHEPIRSGVSEHRTAMYALGISWRTALIAASSVLLTAGIVLVFLAFDRHSHLASDTLRPFVITTFPVWLVFVLGARGLTASRLPG